MSTDAIIPRETSSEWHDAVLRISEALCTCCEPEELAQSLANELDKLLHFDHLYLVVLKENSKEVEYRVCGKGTQLRLNYIFLVDIANPARGQNLVCYDPALVDMQSARWRVSSSRSSSSEGARNASPQRIHFDSRKNA